MLVRFLRSTLLSVLVVFLSCKKEENKNRYHKIDKDLTITLKWNKSYKEDTFQKNVIGLEWCLSYLGSTEVIKQHLLDTQSPYVKLQIDQLGFSNKAIQTFKKLHRKIKKSKEYQLNNAIDIGKYIVLTLGDAEKYFEITDVPSNLKSLKEKYELQKKEGYINNSSVSHVHRIISFSSQQNHSQVYISEEIDSITKAPLEFETVEIMENAQLRFGVYDLNGNLKASASSEITKAGKPGKCIWCHEVNIQPLFKDQIDVKAYLTTLDFQDSLETANTKLRAHQISLWENPNFKEKQNHTFMELSYISFLEPSAEKIANEWNMPIEAIKEKLKVLKTHEHHEFDFLGELYYRKEVDALAPFKTIETVASVREGEIE